MNILPLIRNPAAFMALAVVAPVVFLVGGNFHLPSPSAGILSLDKSTTIDLSGVGVIDQLQSVRATLSGARQAIDSRDYPLANRLAEEAQIGAHVAERRAQSTHARKAAQDSQNAARALRAEIFRKTQPIASN